MTDPRRKASAWGVGKWRERFRPSLEANQNNRVMDYGLADRRQVHDGTCKESQSRASMQGSQAGTRRLTRGNESFVATSGDCEKLKNIMCLLLSLLDRLHEHSWFTRYSSRSRHLLGRTCISGSVGARVRACVGGNRSEVTAGVCVLGKCPLFGQWLCHGVQGRKSQRLQVLIGHFCMSDVAKQVLGPITAD